MLTYRSRNLTMVHDGGNREISSSERGARCSIIVGRSAEIDGVDYPRHRRTRRVTATPQQLVLLVVSERSRNEI